MAPKWEPPNRDELVRLYLAGESQQALAGRYGLPGRLPINRVLKESGVAIRGRAETNRVNAAKRTPAENRRLAESAHRASRGRKHTLEERCKMAATRERNVSGASEAERWLAAELAYEVPHFHPKVTLQKAIGPYNVDLAVGTFPDGPIAVEVFGGHWHGSGRHAARAPKRFRYLLDHGWPFVIVWVNGTYAPLLPPAADYIASFVQEIGGQPPPRREYRVIWGTGEEVVPQPKLDNIARIPARGSSPRRRS